MSYESDYYTSAYLVLQGVAKGMTPADGTTQASIIELPVPGIAVTVHPVIFSNLFEIVLPTTPEDSDAQGQAPSVDITGGPRGTPTSTTQAAGTTPQPTTSGPTISMPSSNY